jgi:hypothetical protein
VNRDWHQQHRLGSDASHDDRVTWHVEHATVCGCRSIPSDVLEEMTRRGIPLEHRRPALVCPDPEAPWS